MGAASVPRRRVVAGGVVLVASLQYLVCELVTAAAWSDPPYDFAHNYVSDLGVTECLDVGRAVCSPLHVVMNVSFVVQGLIAIVAMLLLGGLLRGVRRAVVSVLAVVHGIGLVMVGGFPGSFAEAIGGETQQVIHTFGAVGAILGGALLALACGASLAIGRSVSVGRRMLGVAGLVAGAVPLVSLAASRPIAAVLGEGGLERLGVYPTLAWLVVLGVGVLASVRRSRRR